MLAHLRRRSLATTAAFGLCLAAASAHPGVGPPGSDIASWTDLPRAAAVKDPVFAILLGLLESDGYGTLTRAELDRELGRTGARTRLPYREVETIVRTQLDSGPGSEVTLRFAAAVRVRIPYSILGYHPGRIQSTALCRLREYSLGAISLRNPPAALQDVRLFSVEEGTLDVDIDGWFDALAGRRLDDMRLQRLAVVRYQGRRIGLGVGLNPKGANRCGAFDFAADDVVFPLPPALQAACKALRSVPPPPWP